jgi:hypothetical protein
MFCSFVIESSLTLLSRAWAAPAGELCPIGRENRVAKEKSKKNAKPASGEGLSHRLAESA